MKKLIIVMLGLLLAVSIVGCKSKDSEIDAVIYENTAGNINNGGRAAIQDDKIYYWMKVNGVENALFSIGTDGSGKKYLTDGGAKYINVVGDRIYYFDGNGNEEKIYSMKTDGSYKQKLSDDKAIFMQVVGDWIYYNVREEGVEYTNHELYRMKIDGSDRQLVSLKLIWKGKL